MNKKKSIYLLNVFNRGVWFKWNSYSRKNSKCIKKRSINENKIQNTITHKNPSCAITRGDDNNIPAQAFLE